MNVPNPELPLINTRRAAAANRVYFIGWNNVRFNLTLRQYYFRRHKYSGSLCISFRNESVRTSLWEIFSLARICVSDSTHLAPAPSPWRVEPKVISPVNHRHAQNELIVLSPILCEKENVFLSSYTKLMRVSQSDMHAKCLLLHTLMNR